MLQKFEFKKEVRIAIKSNDTSSYQLETANYHSPASIDYC